MTAPLPTAVRQRRLTLRRLGVLAIAAPLLVGLAIPAGAARGDDPASLSDLQAQRDNVRAQQAAAATELDALRATDAQVTAALAAVRAEVKAQQQRLEEAERARAQAEADRAAAERAEEDARRQLAGLSYEIKRSAVEAYLDAGSGNALSTIGSADANEAVNKKTLLDMRATSRLDAVERFRSVQEDLASQREARVEAEKRAAAEKDNVAARKKELDEAYARQKELADAVDLRLSQELAKAASLAANDKALSEQIQNKQTEIAQAIAAERAAAAAAAGRAAASSPDSVDASAPAGPAITAGPPGSHIVNVYGIDINESVAGQLKAMLEAARAAGINLGGGGFRSPSEQIALRIAHCGSSNYAIYQASPGSCSPPTAIPGQSMHEQGLAIDFKQDGASLSRGMSGFSWLQSNAARYGFYNLPSESWHWSTTGR